VSQLAVGTFVLCHQLAALGALAPSPLTAEAVSPLDDAMRELFTAHGNAIALQ
jgi:hypothetical protein